MPLESCVESRALGVGMGFQGHIIVLHNIRAHCKTGILNQYHLKAFHLHVIYRFANNKQRDLTVPNLKSLSQLCESPDVGHLQN